MKNISTENGQPVLELEDVWKIFRMADVDVPANREINLEVFEGDFIAIIGSSGSGKSTLMNLMGCLDIPTKGKIYLKGKDISKLNENELARIRGKEIGFIFQTFNLYPTLNTADNIALPMRIHGFSEKVIKERLSEILKLVRLQHRALHLPSRLSGGERQRVAIARALSTNPAILLADEPTGNLDSKVSLEILDFFKDLNQKGITIVMITHENYVAKIAKRRISLKDGKIME